MRTIALVAQKGGSGKSTLATGLSVAAEQAGHRVVALDLDPQGSLAGWGELREAESPTVVRVPEDRMRDLGAVLRGVSSQYDVAILDTAGRHDDTTVQAMGLADFVLLPLRPTKVDGMALRPTVEALIRGGKRWAFVLSQCPTGRNTRAAEVATGLSTLGVMAEPPIALRLDYQDAFAQGLGVTEFAPRGSAADEVRGMWAWIERETTR